MTIERKYSAQFGRTIIATALAAGLALSTSASLAAPAAERARDLGIEFEGKPGRLNAITDVKGVKVGFTTLISDGVDSKGHPFAVRTGVTAILPRGQTNSKVPAAWFTLNGNGEMTGTIWIDESGFLEGPVMFTNTFSVGVVRDAVRMWGEKRFPNNDPDKDDAFMLPVVGETWDGYLNDIKGHHVKPQDAEAALEGARRGSVAEGAVGGGTGMMCFDFKCGTGTASRVFRIEGLGRSYTLGVIVQANFGDRDDLTISGVRVGPKFKDQLMPEDHPKEPKRRKRDGSILAVVATDAPLLGSQLRRVARRVALGLARTGSIAHDSSGDIFIAFSTATPKQPNNDLERWSIVPNGEMDEIFRATVQATEEAIINALVAGRDMTGHRGHKVYGIPHDRLREILAKPK